MSALALTGCGGGGGSSSASAPTPSPPLGASTSSAPPPQVGISDADRSAARFLLHAGISASITEIEAIKSEGNEAWLTKKMREPNETSAADFFESQSLNVVDENEFFKNAKFATDLIWSQLFSGGNSLRKRMALALSEILVVSGGDLEMWWASQAMGAYWDILNKHAFGNYRDLLEEIALNPAMGVFLNTQGNAKAETASGRVPDENFAREIMQLFSIGLYELERDGTLRMSFGQPIETYSNDDVTELAKCFTGYNFDFSGLGTKPHPRRTNTFIPDPEYVQRRMTADPTKWSPQSSESLHSPEAKLFLGASIPAGTDAQTTLKIALDTLFHHPNVGPFIGRQLIQRLVTSNPSPSYVQRIASVFDNNGEGVRGDLGAVYRAILLDAEATSSESVSNPLFGKLREPILRFAQWGRTFGASSASGAWDMRATADVALLNQSPLLSPSVFNFFRPGYFPPNSNTSANNLFAPEFQLVNESSVAGYVNFVERTVNGSGYWLGDVTPDHKAELEIAHDSQHLLDRLDLLLTAGQLMQETRDTILGVLDDIAVTEGSDNETKMQRIQIAVTLIMVSNDYLIQK